MPTLSTRTAAITLGLALALQGSTAIADQADPIEAIEQETQPDVDQSGQDTSVKPTDEKSEADGTGAREGEGSALDSDGQIGSDNDTIDATGSPDAPCNDDEGATARPAEDNQNDEMLASDIEETEGTNAAPDMSDTDNSTDESANASSGPTGVEVESTDTGEAPASNDQSVSISFQDESLNQNEAALDVVPAPLIEGAIGTPTLSCDTTTNALIIRTTDVVCGTGVRFVSAQVRSPNGATSWVRLEQDADGAWATKVDGAATTTGLWTVTLWICDECWEGIEAGSASCTLYPGGSAQACAALAYNPATNSVTVSASDVLCSTGVLFVSAAIQAPDGSEQWTRLSWDGEGWSAVVPADQLGYTSGTWRVNLWICDEAWRGVDTGWSPCPLSFGTASGTASLSYDDEAGCVTVRSGDIACTTGILFVSARVVSPSGAAQWVRMYPTDDGAWEARVPAAGNAFEQGAWQASLTVCDTAWRGIPVPGTAVKSLSLGSASTRTEVSTSADASTLTIVARDVDCTSGVLFVSAGITPPSGTTRWIRLDQQADGSWATTQTLDSFGAAQGIWSVTFSVCDRAWRGIPAGTTSFGVSSSSKNDTLVVEDNVVAGNVLITARSGIVDRAVNVAFMVQTSYGVTTWHQAIKQSDGSWSAVVDAQLLGDRDCLVQTVASAGGTTYYLSSAPFSINNAALSTTGAQAACSPGTAADAIVDGAIINDTVYLFLPSNANPTNVGLSFFSGSTAQSLLISGSPTAGFAYITAGETVDLTALTGSDAQANSFTIYVKGDPSDLATRVCIMQSSNQKALFITSSDPINEGRDYVEASPDHSAKTTGSLLVVNADGSIVYDGDLSQIKGRGNSTWTLDKKPYQIKLSKSTSLITGESTEKAKTWVLLANAFDPSMLRNYTAFQLALELGLAGTTDCEPVDLYYDGEYRGTYLLAEKVEVGSSRVDITDLEDLNETYDGSDTADHPTATDINGYGMQYQYVSGIQSPDDYSGGYLLELDNGYYTGERSWFQTSAGSFVVKGPEDASHSEVLYVSELFEKAIGEARKTDGDLKDYFDTASLASTFLVQALAKNSDYMTYSSTYFYKDANDSLIYSGPVWDFDLAFGNHTDTGVDLTSPEGWGNLSTAFFFDNLQFRAEVKRVFSETFDPLVTQGVLGQIGKEETESSLVSVADAGNAMADSAAMNEVLWGVETPNTLAPAAAPTYAANIDRLESWISDRIVWMRNTISSDEW